jgi:hypothetical protein
LLAAERVRNPVRPPPLTREQILSWAQAHHRRTGRWPTRADGPVEEAPGETWHAANLALWFGLRGLPGGSSLALLLRHFWPPSRRYKGQIRRGPPRMVAQRRKVRQLRAKGLTLAKIGEQLGISRQAVHQLLGA